MIRHVTEIILVLEAKAQYLGLIPLTFTIDPGNGRRLVHVNASCSHGNLNGS